MFSASITLPDLPWKPSFDWFSSSYCRKLRENKSFEWQTGFFGWSNMFDFNLDLIPWGSHHASIGISITLFGFMVDAKVYDHRHWDYDNDCWEVYDEAEELAEMEEERANRLAAAYILIEQEEQRIFNEEVAAYRRSPEGIAELELEKRRARAKRDARG